MKAQDRDEPSENCRSCGNLLIRRGSCAHDKECIDGYANHIEKLHRCARELSSGRGKRHNAESLLNETASFSACDCDHRASSRICTDCVHELPIDMDEAVIILTCNLRRSDDRWLKRHGHKTPDSFFSDRMGDDSNVRLSRSVTVRDSWQPNVEQVRSHSSRKVARKAPGACIRVSLQPPPPPPQQPEAPMTVQKAKDAIFPQYVKMAKVCIGKPRGEHACPLCSEGLGELQTRLGERKYCKIADALEWPKNLNVEKSPCHGSRALKGLHGVEDHLKVHAKPQHDEDGELKEEEERDDKGCHILYQEAIAFARGQLPLPIMWRHHLVLIFCRRQYRLPEDVAHRIFEMTKPQP